MSSIYVAMPFALLYFGYMTLLGWASYRLIEGPLMRFRRPYLRERKTADRMEARTDALSAPVRAL